MKQRMKRGRKKQKIVGNGWKRKGRELKPEQEILMREQEKKENEQRTRKERDFEKEKIDDQEI